MRTLALFGLLLFQDPDIDSLLKQLSDESIEVREKATAALLALGDKAEGRLKTEAASAEGEHKARVEKVLLAIENARKLRAVLPQHRKVTLEAKGRPLKEVLAEFREKSGLSVKLEGTGDDPITVSVSEVTPLQALDAICKSADMGYSCSGRSDFDRVRREMVNHPAELRIGGKYSEFPRAFAGHYGIFASNLTVSRTTNFDSTIGGALVNLAVFYPEEARPERVSVEVLAATDDKGRSVKWEDRNPPGYSMSMSGVRREPPSRQTAQAWLKCPEPDAAKVASLKVRLKATYIVERRFVTFESPGDAPDQSKEYDGVKFDLKGFKHESETVKFNLEITGERRTPSNEQGRWNYGGRSFDAHKVTLKAEGDSPISQGGYSGGGDGKMLTYKMTFHAGSSKVTAVQIEVDGRLVEDVVEVELKDIPLPK